MGVFGSLSIALNVTAEISIITKTYQKSRFVCMRSRILALLVQTSVMLQMSMSVQQTMEDVAPEPTVETPWAASSVPV